MKKILLSSLAILMGCSVFAQRSIDLSVDSFITPKVINSNTQTGTPISIHAVMTNNSATDTVKVGDTLIFQSTLRTTANQVITGTQALFRIVDRPILPGDTQHFKLNYTWNSYLINSMRVNLTLIVWVTNRPDLPIDNGTNNALVTEMDYINPNGFGVSVANIDTKSASVYPNPAINKVQIDIPAIEVNKSVEVSLTDLTGKVLLAESFDNTAQLEMNTQTLKNGVYLMKVVNGSNVYSSKVVVSK